MEDFWTYLWPLLNLPILIYLGVRYGKKPLLDFVSNYRDEVDRSLKRAEEDRVNAREQLELWRERWESIDSEISIMLERAKDNARRRKEELEREARAEKEHREARMEESLRRDREKVIRSLREDAASILVEATAATLDEVVTSRDQNRLVGEFTRELRDIV
ncbi:MAG: hypothetical protein ACLFS8_03795 [Clostridia bacterium]